MYCVPSFPFTHIKKIYHSNHEIRTLVKHIAEELGNTLHWNLLGAAASLGVSREISLLIGKVINVYKEVLFFCVFFCFEWWFSTGCDSVTTSIFHDKIENVNI